MTIRFGKTAVLLGILLVGAVAAPAVALPITGTYTTAGATTGTGPWTLTSTDATSSILRFVFDTPVLFSDLTDLNIDYNALLGGIGGGGPRAVFVVDTNNDNLADGSFIAHWGPSGSFVDPTLGLGNTGNLLAMADNGRYDLGGIGGSAYTDLAAAHLAADTYSVLRVSIILDSFGGADKTFVINGVNVAGNTAVPEPASMVLLGSGLVGFAARRRARGHRN